MREREIVFGIESECVGARVSVGARESVFGRECVGVASLRERESACEQESV